MKKLTFLIFTALLGIGLVLSNIPNVIGQESDDEFTLEEITVTAERRSMDVQKTAISMSTISGDEIAEKSYNSIDSYLSKVMGMEFAGHASGGSLAVRGVSSNVEIGIGDPAVTLMVDGVNNNENMALKGSMFDVKRVEVLRGPQGTLYGMNAIAGAVNLLTNDPVDEFEASGRLQVGNYSLLRVDGMVNVPLSEKFAGRAVFSKTTRDGYLSNGNLSADTWNARFKLLFEPNDDLMILATWEHQTDESRLPATVPARVDTYLGPNLVDTYNPDDPWYSSYPRSWMDDKSDSYKLQIDWNLGFGQLTVLPALIDQSKINEHAIVGPTIGIMPPQERGQKQRTLEVRLVSPAESELIWVVGFYGINRVHEDNNQTGEERPGMEPDDYRLIIYERPVTSYSGFGQGTYPLTDRFRLTAGLRHNIDLKKNKLRIWRPDPAYDSGIVEWEKDYKKLTYKAGIEYDLSTDSMLYAQVSTGYKAGGLANTVPPSEYEPEYLTSIEFGSKNRIMDDRFQLNGAAYYYRYENYQLQVAGATFEACVAGECGEFSGFVMRNAGLTKNYGLEMEAQYLITPNDNLGLSVTMNRTELGHFIVPGQEYEGVQVSEDQDITGSQMPNAPDWTVDLSYDHDWNLSNGGTLSASADLHFSAGLYVSPEYNLVGCWQEAYQKYNAYLGYSSPSGKWSLNLFGKNLSNEDVTTFILPLGRRMIGDPSTFGATFTIRY